MTSHMKKKEQPLFSSAPAGMAEMDGKGQACALLILAAEALLMVLWAYAPSAVDKALPAFGIPLAFAFAGLALASCKRRPPLVCWMGAAVVVWYALSRIWLGDLYLQQSGLYFARTAANHLVALPFAFALGDGARRRGLDLTAAIYALGLFPLALAGVLCTLLNTHIYLPIFSTEIFFLHNRLCAGQHPNGSAMLFLLGMLFTLYLMMRYPRWWTRVLGAVMLCTFYMGVAFTDSRTVMIECALAAAALAFSAVLRLKRPSRMALRVCAAVAAAAVALAACYAGMHGCIKWQASFSSHAEEAAREETVAQKETPVAIPYRPLLRDVATLTGRTDIYKAVLRYVGHHPDTLLAGMLERDIVTHLQAEVYPEFVLAHNAWLQALLTTGLPGLLLGLYFTWHTLRLGVRGLLVRQAQTGFADKMILLLPLLLVLNCVTECVLFAEQFSVANFAYLLCLGYATQRDSLPDAA